MTFKEKLVKLRKLKGITQDEFASAVGVSRQAVYKWESGQSYPEVPKLIEMKALFGISIDDLLDENYEVIVPEKKKKRLSSIDKRKIEQKVDSEVNASLAEAVNKPADEVAEKVTAVAAEPVSSVAEPVAVENTAVEETVAPVVEPVKETVTDAEPTATKDFSKSEEKTSEQATYSEKANEKKGFFSKLFGRK